MASKKPGRPPTIKPAESQITSDSPRIREVAPTLRIAVRRESVFNGLEKRVKDYLGRLPVATDDLSSEMGLDLMERMYNDPQIAASCETLNLQAVSRGLRVKLRYSDRKHPMYKKGVEAYDLVSYAMESYHSNIMDALPVSINEHLEDMARSRLKFGNAVSELTFKIQEGGPLSGKMVPDMIQPLSPYAYSFIVDAYGATRGIAVYTGDDKPIFGTTTRVIQMPSYITNGRFESDASTLPAGWEIAPVGKFLVTTHRRKHGDPRGQSALRQAFSAWYLSMQIWPEYLKYLTQFAGPSLFATTPEKAQPRKDPISGEIKYPLDVLYEELLNFANGSVSVAEYGTELTAMNPAGEGQAFVSAINLLNHEKVKAILYSILATEAPGNQTRSSQQGGKDIVDLPARGIRNDLSTMIEQQYFRKIVYFNMGPEAAQYLTPRATLGDISPEDRNEALRSYGAAGFKILPSQFAGVADSLEMDQPSEEDLETLAETATNEAKGKLPQPGAPTQGGGAKSTVKRPDRDVNKDRSKRAK